ncbi:hypothetical protein ANO14919_135880 [Xylariales sp. No.14919]|nr:hypothetical protein ANO14919_135880 [Xylariales sp. No.14919]
MVLVARLVLIVWAFTIHFTTITANPPPCVTSSSWPLILGLLPGSGYRDKHALFRNIIQGSCRPMSFDVPEFYPNGVKMGIRSAFRAEGKAPRSWWRTIFEVPDLYLNIAVHAAKEWIAEAEENLYKSPMRTALEYTFHAAKVRVWMVPRVIWGPAVNALGFGTAGVGRGTVAAAIQSMIGTVKACSFFAYLQSAGAGGYGATAINTAVRGVMYVRQLLGF